MDVAPSFLYKLPFVIPVIWKWVTSSPSTEFLLITKPELLSISSSVVVSVILGISATGNTVIIKVCSKEVLSPPIKVPPLSDKLSVTVVKPCWFGVGVNISVPTESIIGALINKVKLSLVTSKVKVWLLSLRAPA